MVNVLLLIVQIITIVIIILVVILITFINSINTWEVQARLLAASIYNTHFTSNIHLCSNLVITILYIIS